MKILPNYYQHVIISQQHTHLKSSTLMVFINYLSRYRKNIPSIFYLLVILLSQLIVGAEAFRLSKRDLHQRFANEPSPQTAVIGSTVVLPCRVIDKVGELQWTRDDFGLGNERELVAFKRYKMIGSHEEGDFSLRISPVTLEDDAEFQCQVLGVGAVRGVRSESAKLTVYVPPERPAIIQGPVVTSTAGAGVQIECVSRGGKPAAEIQWLDGAGREYRDGVVYTTEILKDNHRQNAKSTLSFVATKEHHSAVITCTASNPAVNQPLSTQVRLEVTYPPEVIVKHTQSSYNEGATATLSCEATANPAVLTFRWYRGDKLVSNENSTQLVIENVSRDNNLEDVTCEVSNEVGASKQITRINVLYGPSFTSDPDDVYASPGEEVSLTCHVDSNPEATIVWVGQQEQTVMNRGAAMQLQANHDTVGNYLCIAKVHGFQEISASFGLFLKGPPVVRAESSQWGNTGDTITLDCYVTSASHRSLTVTWSKYDDKVDLEPGRFEEVEELTSRGLRYSLLIHNAKHQDFGSYNCSAQNNYGSATTQINLEKKKGIPMLLLAGGVVLAVVFVFIIAAFVIFFGKKSSEKQKEMKNNAELPEKTVTLQLSNHISNSTGSDLKVDFDNRSGSSVINVKDSTDLDSWEKDGSGSIGTNGTIIGSNGREVGSLPPIVSSPNNAPTPPSYHLTTSSPHSYLYPEGFSRLALKNGHLLNNGNSYNYNNYAENNTLPLHKPGVITSGFSSSALNSGFSTIGPTYSQGPLVTSNQHNIFPNYGDYEITRENVDNSSPSTRGYTEQNMAFSTLPFSHHLTSHNNNGVIQAVSVDGAPFTVPPSSTSTSEQVNSSASTTLPRLGIPVESSQYIMPPRTQVMQGALATHV